MHENELFSNHIYVINNLKYLSLVIKLYKCD